MIYFVTGASGFIGKRLVRTLLSHPGSTVYFLLRDPSAERLAKLRGYWEAGGNSTIPVAGDLTKPGLGVAADDFAVLKTGSTTSSTWARSIRSMPIPRLR